MLTPMTGLRGLMYAGIVGIVFAFSATATAGAETFQCGEPHWRKGEVIDTYLELQITPLAGSHLKHGLCGDALAVAEKASRPEEPEGTYLSFTTTLGRYHCTTSDESGNELHFACTVHGHYANRVAFDSLLQRAY